MTASLPQPPESASAGSEDDAASVDASPSPPPRPRAPRRPAAGSASSSAGSEAADADTPEGNKSATPRASSARNAGAASAARSPRTPAAKKPATPRAASAKKPATPRATSARKPAAPRVASDEEAKAPRATPARKPAAPRASRAKKPPTAATASPSRETPSPVVDPGPPPPLPANLIVPPRPPLPADIEPAAPAVDAGVPAVDPTPADVAVEEPRTAEPESASVDEPDVDVSVVTESADDVLVAEEPVPDAPVLEQPVVDEPVAAETVADVPVAMEPASDEPVAEEPTADEPEAEAPVPEAVAAEEPTADDPKTGVTVLDTAEPPRDESAESTAGADPVVVEPDAERAMPGESADGDDGSAGEAAAEPAGREMADAPVEATAPAELTVDEALEDAIVDTGEPGAAPKTTDSHEEAAPTTASDVPALRLRNITKNFGELRAVDGVDLTVPAGSFYGLVGPNGAGKTTTLSIIAGLLRSDGGTVEINGLDASRKSRAAKKMIGVLPDRLRTFDRLTGRQLLSYYGALRGLPSPVVESRAADLARAFDLVDALGRPVSDYSAGMTKKVMLAGAMIHSPRLLVLDEPFEAVDPVSSAVILDILRAYVEHGGTVILSSHGMELVERVCSRVAVIVSGQVLAEGTVDEVRGESTLEQRFLELSGGLGDVEGLEWLHTFSA